LTAPRLLLPHTLHRASVSSSWWQQSLRRESWGDTKFPCQAGFRICRHRGLLFVSGHTFSPAELNRTQFGDLVTIKCQSWSRINGMNQRNRSTEQSLYTAVYF
jgi:hypothetical protein